MADQTDMQARTVAPGYRTYKVAEFPVGRCPGIVCKYPEAHRHGVDCDQTCVCFGKGAQVRSLQEGSVSTCDWGACDREAVAERHSRAAEDNGFDDVWLSVCTWHAGWDDYEGYENV